MSEMDVEKLSIHRGPVTPSSRSDGGSKRVALDFSTRDYRRGANDLCVYVLKPGDSSKRMIVVNAAGSWKDFLNTIGEKLKINVLRVFNKRDEIKKLSDLSQGDILAIQHGIDKAPSPKETNGKLHLSASMHWAKLCRLITLQCLDDYVVTEVIKSGKHHETLKARRKHDNLPVIIKRISSSKSIHVSTLRSYIPLCCSIRHPRFANQLDVFISTAPRRPPGISKSRKKNQQENFGVLTIVMERYDTNLETYFEQRLKLQKPLTSHEIVDFVTQILHILHYLHSDLRTVHRNIKMSNCLLDKSGNVYLADFAVPSVNPSADAYHMRHLCRGSVAQRRGLMTPKVMYCSPEAFLTGCTSEKDDIWALGCIITELVTHKSVADRTSGEIFGRSLGAIAQAVAEVECKDSALGSLCRIFLDAEAAKRPSAFEVLWRHMRTVYPDAHHQAVSTTLNSQDTSITSMLSRSSDIPTLITAILRHEFSTGMEAAAMRLNEILHSEPNKRSSMRDIFATPIGRMTGLNALSSCLLKGSPFAQQLAASALRTATLDDENEKSFSSSDVGILVAAVLMGNPPTQANAAAVLSNICCNSARIREALHIAKGINALTALISSGTSSTCLLEAASAIRNACIGHEGNREDFMVSGGVATLVRVLQSDFVGHTVQNSRVIMTLENVIGALRNCCNQHNGNCMKLAEAEGIPVVVRLISNAPLNIQEQIAGLIRNSCIGYFENKNQMARCGAYWSFVQMLNQTALTSSVREEVVSAVRYSTVGHKSNRNSLGESGLIRALVNILLSGSFEGSMRAKEEAAAALRIACDGSEANSAELFKCCGIQALMDLLSCGSSIAREEAMCAAANACSHFPANIDLINNQVERMNHVKAIMTSGQATDEAKFYAKCLLMLVDQRKPKLACEMSGSVNSLDGVKTNNNNQTSSGVGNMTSISDEYAEASPGQQFVPGFEQLHPQRRKVAPSAGRRAGGRDESRRERSFPTASPLPSMATHVSMSSLEILSEASGPTRQTMHEAFGDEIVKWNPNVAHDSDDMDSWLGMRVRFSSKPQPYLNKGRIAPRIPSHSDSGRRLGASGTGAVGALRGLDAASSACLVARHLPHLVHETSPSHSPSPSPL